MVIRNTGPRQARIVNTGPKQKRVDPALVAKALGAEPVGIKAPSDSIAAAQIVGKLINKSQTVTEKEATNIDDELPIVESSHMIFEAITKAVNNAVIFSLQTENAVNALINSTRSCINV